MTSLEPAGPSSSSSSFSSSPSTSGPSPSSPVGSDSGYNSGARTPQPIESSTSSSATSIHLTSSFRQHQRQRSSVSIPLNLTNRTVPRKSRPEPPDNTLNIITRQELSWEEQTPTPTSSSSSASSTSPLSLSQSPSTPQAVAPDRTPYHQQPFSTETYPTVPPHPHYQSVSSAPPSSTSDHSRPASVISNRPTARKRGTLGYVVSPAHPPPHGHLPDSAASSLSSHHSSPRSPSVYGGSIRERKRTTSGWTSTSSLAFSTSSSPHEAPSSARSSRANSLVPSADGLDTGLVAVPTQSQRSAHKLASSLDRPVQEGTTLLSMYKDLLSAIAAKQRTVAELKQELEREESELRDLQRRWEEQVQAQIAAQSVGNVAAVDTPITRPAAGGPVRPFAHDHHQGTSSTQTSGPAQQKRLPQLSTSHLSNGHEGAHDQPMTPSATETFKKLLGGWGIGTPSASKSSASNNYFSLPTEPAPKPVPVKPSPHSKPSSGASTPHTGTPSDDLSDAEEAELMAHFQPRDLDKERESERKQANRTTIIATPGGRNAVASAITGPSVIVGTPLERTGNRTPTPQTRSEDLDKGLGPPGQVSVPPVPASMERKSSIASETSESSTPKLPSISNHLVEGETGLKPAMQRVEEEEVQQQQQHTTPAAKLPVDTGATRKIGLGVGRKLGQGAEGGGGESLLFPRKTETNAAPTSSNARVARSGANGNSRAKASMYPISTSTSAVAANDDDNNNNEGTRSPSSFPAWGVKRFSMLGESLSAFSAKVEEQFALAASAASSTATAPTSPPPPAKGPTGSQPIRRQLSAQPAELQGVSRDRTMSLKPEGSGMAGQAPEQVTTVAAAAAATDSPGGLTSTFSAWSTKRLKEAGEFFANAERTIGNALVLDDPSPPPGRGSKGSHALSAGGYQHARKDSRGYMQMNGGGGGRGSIADQVERRRSQRVSMEQQSSVDGASSVHGQNSTSGQEVALGATAEKTLPPEQVSAGAPRQSLQDSRAAPLRHNRTSSILSGGTGSGDGSSSGSGHGHRRSASSILSSAEAGVSSLFGMLSSALTVPPDEVEEQERDGGSDAAQHHRQGNVV